MLRELSWPATVGELTGAVGPSFRPLPGTPVEGAVTLVHSETLVIVEAAAQGRTLVSPVGLIEGEDARTYFADLLGRLTTVNALIDELTSIQSGPPLVLEVHRRGQRLLLPDLLCVVEADGRRRLEGVRLLQPAGAYRAIDSWLRLQSSRPAIEVVMGRLRRVEAGLWLTQRGRLGIKALEGGGHALVSGAALVQSLISALSHAPDAATADAMIGAWFTDYGRRESADARGRAVVSWRIPVLDADFLRAADGRVVHTPHR